MNFADVAQSPAQPAKENEAFLAFQLTFTFTVDEYKQKPRKNTCQNRIPKKGKFNPRCCLLIKTYLRYSSYMQEPFDHYYLQFLIHGFVSGSAM